MKSIYHVLNFVLCICIQLSRDFFVLCIWYQHFCSASLPKLPIHSLRRSPTRQQSTIRCSASNKLLCLKNCIIINLPSISVPKEKKIFGNKEKGEIEIYIYFLIIFLLCIYLYWMQSLVVLFSVLDWLFKWKLILVASKSGYWQSQLQWIYPHLLILMV